MFAKFDDSVTPTSDGLDSLRQAGMCTDEHLAMMRSMMLLQAKLPAAYRVVDSREGADHPWIRVRARWDGKPLNGDPSEEIAEAVKPLTVRRPNYKDGLFSWMVQAPDPDEKTKSEKAPPKASSGSSDSKSA